MKKLTLGFVLEQMPRSFLYLISAFVIGTISGYILFYYNKQLFEHILNLWFKRILFGVGFFGEYYGIWFIINNVVALMLVIVSTVLIMIHISKTPTFFITKRFRSLEKHRPKITLFGLYMVPVGALLINGFLISLFVTYVLLNSGFSSFVSIILLLLPHGVSELLALLFASSLGLAYLKILSPIILKKKWSLCTKTGKKLLTSRVTLLVIAIVAILVVFSGFIEGMLGLFLY